MIRYILVDDDQKTLDRVKAKIDSIAKDFELEHISSYSSSKEAAETLNPDSYDLLIVDFEMPVYNGLELAKQIANNKKIIFLTSTSNNEQEVINSLDIAGYLSKPFDIHEFQLILKNKVLSKYDTNKTHRSTQSYVLSISKNRDIHILPEKVYYIRKGKANYVNIYGENDTLLFKNVRRTISELADELEHLKFLRINQSIIVNKSFIKERDNMHVELYNCKESFEVKNTYKTFFIERLKGIFSRF